MRPGEMGGKELGGCSEVGDSWPDAEAVAEAGRVGELVTEWDRDTGGE